MVCGPAYGASGTRWPRSTFFETDSVRSSFSSALSRRPVLRGFIACCILRRGTCPYGVETKRILLWSSWTNLIDGTCVPGGLSRHRLPRYLPVGGRAGGVISFHEKIFFLARMRVSSRSVPPRTEKIFCYAGFQSPPLLKFSPFFFFNCRERRQVSVGRRVRYC